MGGKGSKTQTATSTNTPPADVMANYDAITAQAKQVAQTPYTPFTGQLTAPFNATEQAATNAIPGAATAYQPYYSQAQGLIGQGTQQFSPTQFSASAVSQYENPYTQDVINSTMANINQENAKQQQSMTGNAIASGAWGGDRADLAKNDLARQQALATGQTIAGLENQNYQQALGQFNTANQTGLQAAGLNAQTALQGAGLQGAMGNYASQLGLAGAGAQLSAGALQQQSQNAADQAALQQYQQQQSYPFQTAQWLSNIYSQGAGQMGGTSSTTQPVPGQGNSFSSGIGAGLGTYGLLAMNPATAPFALAGGLGMGAAGLFGLASGGKVERYAPGGSIVDFDDSYVPRGQLINFGTGIPKTPTIQQDTPAKQNPLSSLSLMSQILKGHTGLPSDQGQIINQTPSGAGIVSDNEKFVDFARGGEVTKYANGGWENQPLFDSPMYTPQLAMDMESSGRLPSGGMVGGLPLSAEMNNRLATELQNPDAPQTAEPQNNTGVLHTGTFPVPGFTDPQKPAASPEDMQALMAGVGQDQTDTDLGFPDAPRVASSGIANSDAPQGIIAGQPQELTDLQKQLAANAPALDQNQAIAMAGLAMMAGKNRSAAQNIGEGAMAGLQDYAGQKQAVRDYALKEAEVQKQVEQLAQLARYHNEEMDLKKEQIDQGKFGTPVAGMGKDENGKDVPGSYITNSKTGEMTFKPGVVQTAKGVASVGASGVSQDPEIKKLSGQDFYDAVKEKNPDYADKIFSLAKGYTNWPTQRDINRNPELAQEVSDARKFDSGANANRAKNAAKWEDSTSFTGKKLIAGNTAVSHMGMLMDAIDAQKNGNIPALNLIRNKWLNETGSDLPTNLDIDKAITLDEVAKFVIPGVGAQADREQFANTMRNNGSPEQLKGGMKQYYGLMRGQMKSMRHAYETETGRDDFDRFLDPDVKEKIGGGAETKKPAYSDEDIAHTAKIHNMTIEDVKKKLGIK